ncbi:protein phosphatase 2C domain-containing protein [Streptomyces sp. Ag109_O5-1]|uniref:protein phosphatase 2C domain-containing protein n=1 Tax=Streptomyces sp. Ag109_O5-1 TaxID=1938851 RepID=UPI000F4FD068|nr:protein phosphatase 2C domain-containing protein [Streptomyces sp. Ag109_O5-1]
MSQPGGRPARHEDDWWGQLYDDSTEDTGPTAAPDSLDDRFASAKHTVAGRRGVAEDPVDHDRQSPPTVPAQRAPGEDAEADPQSWPWDEEDQALPPTDEATTPPHPTTRPDVPTLPPPSPPVAPPSAPTSAPATPSLAPAAPSSAPAAWPSTPAISSSDPVDSPSDPAAWPATPAALSSDPVDSPSTPAISSSDPVDSPSDPAAWPATPAVPSSAPVASFSALGGSFSAVEYVGSGPPTYDAEPTALPVADPDELEDLVADTVLDGARYGACTLRAVSQRGDSARYRGEPRRDALLTARFGSGDQALVLVAMATGARATPGAHRAAAEVCEWIARAVGRSHQRLTADIQAARRGDLKSGLHRLTDRSLGKLRASAAEQGIAPDEYAASLRCLLIPAHPQCRTRVFFGVGTGGLFRLRDGEWQDIEPRVDTDTPGEAVVGFGSLPAETPEGDRLTMDLGIPTPPSPFEPAPEPPREPFLFRASVARPGDALVMCTAGLADPLRGEPALCAYLARRWSGRTPPGLAAFLADAQVRVKGYADDRTAAAVWEA